MCVNCGALRVTENVADEIPFSGRKFPISGGVTLSVLEHLSDFDAARVKPILVDGLIKSSLKQLRTIASGKAEGNFIEVMTCEGGCINGCSVICNPKVAKRQIEAHLKKPELVG